jgi:hypothetical protein
MLRAFTVFPSLAVDVFKVDIFWRGLEAVT